MARTCRSEYPDRIHDIRSRYEAARGHHHRAVMSNANREKAVHTSQGHFGVQSTSLDANRCASRMSVSQPHKVRRSSGTPPIPMSDRTRKTNLPVRRMKPVFPGSTPPCTRRIRPRTQRRSSHAAAPYAKATRFSRTLGTRDKATANRSGAGSAPSKTHAARRPHHRSRRATDVRGLAVVSHRFHHGSGAPSFQCRLRARLGGAPIGDVVVRACPGRVR